MAYITGKLAGNISVQGQGQKNSECELTLNHEFKITHDDPANDFLLGSKSDEKITAFIDYNGDLRSKINSSNLEKWWRGEENIDWRYGVPISFSYSKHQDDYIFKFNADYTITTNKDDGNNLKVVKNYLNLTANSTKIYNYYKTGTLRVYKNDSEEILEANVTIKGERIKHSSGIITLDIIPITSNTPQSFIRHREIKIKPANVDADNGSFQKAYTSFVVSEDKEYHVDVAISAAVNSSGSPIVSIQFNLINDESEKTGKITFK